MPVVTNKFYSIALTLLFSALIWLVLPMAAPYVAAVLVLIHFVPRQKILIIGLATLLFQLLPGELTFFYFYSQLEKILDPSLPTYVRKLSWFAGLISIVTLFILIQLRRVLIASFKSPYLVGLSAVLGCFVLLIVGVEFKIFNAWTQAFAVWITIAISKYIWYFAYDLQNRQVSPHQTFIERAGFYSQFWTFRLIAPTIPKGESFWTRFEVTNPRQSTKVQYEALALLIWAASLKFVFDGLENSLQTNGFFGIFQFYSIDQMLHLVKQNAILPWSQVFLSGMADNFFSLMSIVVWGHVTVSVIWFCGYKVPRNTDDPHLSKDPLDFFSRINFYLKEAVFQLFYFPCFLRFKGWTLGLRVFISIFYAVSIGKFLLNFTKFAPLILEMGLVRSLHQHAAYFIYCVLLTLLLFPFLLKSQRSERQKPLGVFQRLVYSLIIFSGYTAIRMFDTIAMNDIVVNTKLLLLFIGIRV